MTYPALDAEPGAGLIVAALALVRWLGTHMRLIWRAQRQQPAWTLTATVIRPLPRRVIRGEIER